MLYLDCVEKVRVGLIEYMHRNYLLSAKHLNASGAKIYAQVVPCYQALAGSTV